MSSLQIALVMILICAWNGILLLVINGWGKQICGRLDARQDIASRARS